MNIKLYVKIFLLRPNPCCVLLEWTDPDKLINDTVEDTFKHIWIRMMTIALQNVLFKEYIVLNRIDKISAFSHHGKVFLVNNINSRVKNESNVT